MANEEIFDKLRDAIVTQNVSGIAQLTREALDAGIPPIDIINKGLSVGMKIVGDKFEAAEVFLASDHDVWKGNEQCNGSPHS